MSSHSFISPVLLLSLGCGVFAAAGSGNSTASPIENIAYWGQNAGGDEKPLASYCTNDQYDALIISSVINFADPQLSLDYGCDDGQAFPGTSMSKCPQIAKDIATCQAKEKKILLSVCGPKGGSTCTFNSDADGVKFANELWSMFGAGNSTIRPFGKSAVDGFDIDVGANSNSNSSTGSTGMAAFAKQLNTLAADRPGFLLTAATGPEVPNPVLTDAIGTAKFDMLYVKQYSDPMFNKRDASAGPVGIETWGTYLKSYSANKNARVMMGVAGSPRAAANGYLTPEQVDSAKQNYRNIVDNFGGVMVWDASAVNTVPGSNAAQDAAPAAPAAPAYGAAEETHVTQVITDIVHVTGQPPNELMATEDVTTVIYATRTFLKTRMVPNTNPTDPPLEPVAVNSTSAVISSSSPVPTDTSIAISSSITSSNSVTMLVTTSAPLPPATSPAFASLSTVRSYAPLNATLVYY